MVETQPCRMTREVPLVRLEAFCRSLQNALAAAGDSAEVAPIWRLYVSAECPMCGIRICGDELRSLAFAPCAELASAKIGRMRLGSCARRGCEGWHYAVHFWNQEGIDWPSLVAAIEKSEPEKRASPPARGRQRWVGLASPARGYVARAAAVLGVIFALWFAREIYLGGRIPLLREPEKFRIDTTPLDSTWPAPLDGA